MQLNINHYQGREQSFIKHLFLQKYLESAAYKLFQGRTPVFNFVDAFAGPWRNSDSESLSDTSFALALTTLENVRGILTNLGHSNLRVRFRFCEKNPESLAKLQTFASSKTDFDIKVFSGAFEDNLAGIQAACSDVRDSFTFTFIDPTGWNVDSRPIFSFLKDLRGEVLFNFMSEHVNRHAGWDGVATSVGRFLADPAWRPTFEALPDISNEEKVLRLFKAKMKEAGAATHHGDAPDEQLNDPRLFRRKELVPERTEIVQRSNDLNFSNLRAALPQGVENLRYHLGRLHDTTDFRHHCVFDHACRKPRRHIGSDPPPTGCLHFNFAEAGFC